MNKAPVPYWPVHVAEVLADPRLASLDTEAFGVFWRLALHAWLAGGYIPRDEKTIQRLAGVMHPRTWHRVWPIVRPCFDHEDSMGLSSCELQDAYAEALERVGRQSEKAKKAAVSRWAGHAPSNATSISAHTGANSPSTATKQRSKEETKEVGRPSMPPLAGGVLKTPRLPAAINNLLPNLSADRQPEEQPTCEPAPAEVERQTGHLVPYIADRRAVAARAAGPKLGNSDLFGRALAELSDDDFLSCCGYTAAWKLANPHRSDYAPSVLVSRLKKLLLPVAPTVSAEGAPGGEGTADGFAVLSEAAP